MLRRKRNNLTSGNCMYIEGRDRSYGTCAGRRDGLAMLRRKRNSLTSGNCTLRDGIEAMVFWCGVHIPRKIHLIYVCMYTVNTPIIC
jgi:hypothetical protein